LKKISAAVAAVLVSGTVMTATAITMAPAHAQDRPPVATTPGIGQPGTEAVTGNQNRQVAPRWYFTGQFYAGQSACVDDGQEYQREGYPYQCRFDWVAALKQNMYWLWIYE
jgi:hypothetical protein